MLINFFLAGVADGLLDAFRKLLPDVTIGYKDSRTSREIFTSITHELGHTSHFRQVGSRFWAKYVGYITRSYQDSGNYGNGTRSDFGYCDVGEMYGFAMEEIRSYHYTSGNPPNSDSGVPNYFGSFWFKPKFIWDLYCDRVLTHQQIFSCLTSDVITKELLRDKMINKYPAKKDAILKLYNKNMNGYTLIPGLPSIFEPAIPFNP